MSFGEALALGVAKGVGEGFQDYYRDQRRERMSDRQMAKSFDMFKKQSQYSYGLQEIGKMNDSLGKWETAAKLDTNDLAFQAATKMASVYGKADRPKVIQGALKNFQGMSKAELLSRAGYNKPDYSNYIDNPDYQDAIPRSRIAGMADMPDMESTFQYDPRNYADLQKVQSEKMTDYMRKKADELSAIGSMSVVSFGAKPSEELSTMIWKNRPEGVNVAMKGAEAVSYDQNLLDSLITSGQAVKIGSQIKLRGELTEKDKTLLGIPDVTQQAPTGDVATLYTEPTTKQYVEDKEDKAVQKQQRSMASKVEKDQGQSIKSYTALQDLGDQLQTLSPEAKEILFGGVSLKGALSLTDIGRKIAAKADVEGAQEARKFLSLMENISATLKHEQYGSAQTATELKNFADQLGNPGILQNPETLMDQIGTRKELLGGDLSATIGLEGREAYLAQHPEMAERLGEVFGGEQIGQVSDLGESTEEPQGQFSSQGITEFVDRAIASGEYKESQRADLVAFMMQKAGLQQ